MSLPIKFTELDYDVIISSLINIVKDHPDYNILWDDFLLSNVGRMMIELFAFIADNLATRIDWVARENWIETATQKESIVRILKLLGYNFSLPSPANVDIIIDHRENFPGTYFLTKPYNPSIGSINPFSLQTVTETGANKIFEAVHYDDISKKYDYKSGIKVDNNTITVTFYEGKTVTDDFQAATENGPIFNLTRSPVVENSIIVYQVFNRSGNIIEQELQRVDTFLSPIAQLDTNNITGQPNPIPYIQSVNENDTVSIEFGQIGLLESPLRRLNIGDRIKVFYRIGGGKEGNIVAQKLNTEKSFTVTPIEINRNVVVNPTFVNNYSAAGGKDGEDPSVAAINAPKEIRTVKKAVTPQDYNILLLNEGSILSAKSFGASNRPENSFDLYNEYLNPLDVWIYTIPDAIGRIGLLPSKYDKFEWISLNKQNRYNEIYNFNSGGYNIEDTKMNSNINKVGNIEGTIYRNYFVLNTNQDIKDNFENGNFKVKVSNTLDSNRQFANIQNLSVDTGDTLNFVVLSEGDTRFSIKENINAYFESSIDLDNGINLSSRNKIRLNIDEKGVAEVNLTSSALDSNRVRVEEISVAINKAMQARGNTYGSTSGLSGVSSVIERGNARFIRIQSPRAGDSSTVKILPPTGDTATGLVFGEFVNTGDSNINYGYKTLTLNTEDGNLIHETGSLNLNGKNNYYIHYLLGDTEIINIGDYYKDTYRIGEPEYKDTAKRVYNTQYTIGDTANVDIDFRKSRFVMKFTNNKTDKHSVYAINNSWSLDYAEPPKLQSRTFSGSTINNLDSTNYNIRINIDNLGWRTIDVTGNEGISPSYSTEIISDSINNDLTAAYSGDTYDVFEYAILENNNIILRSPTGTKHSSLAFDAVSNNAFTELFPSGSALIHYTTGDYYLQYNSDINNMEMVKIPKSNIPDLNFYLHYIWDRSLEKTIEDNFQTFLEDKKIISVNNIFREPRFFTFDIFGEVLYNPNHVELVVKSDVEEALKEEFGFIDKKGTLRAEIGRWTYKSRVIKVITDVPGVENVNINYFGKNAKNKSTNEDLVISAEFDETAILSENRLDSANNILNGINIIYTKLEIRG